MGQCTLDNWPHFETPGGADGVSSMKNRSEDLKTLYLDMDGVVVDLVLAMMNRHGAPYPYENKERHGIFEMSGFFGLSREAMWDGLDADFWASAPPHDDLPATKAAISEVTSWDNVCIVTSPVSVRTGDCVDGKLRWIRRHIPELPAKNVAFCAKKYLLAGPDKVLLDDWEENTVPFDAAGGRSVLFPRHWNTRHEQVDRFSLIDELRRAMA